MDRMRRDSSLWPFDDFERLREEINQLFDVGPEPVARGLFDRVQAPRIDVLESSDTVIVECDVPGVEQDDLELALEKNMLTVRGTKRSAWSDEHSGAQRSAKARESWAGEFQRTLLLPETIDPDRVEAELRNGVLRVTIAKREEVKPKRIAISAQN